MDHHLAQINIARFRRPIEDPVNADFVAALDRVNAIAEGAPGFVWRLKGDGNDATDLAPYEDRNIILNMSVWRDVETLAAFAYRDPAHRAIMRRRREWFETIDVHMALWWVPAGHRPTVADGRARLMLLSRLGPTLDAFTFQRPFGPPGQRTPVAVLDRCA